MKQKLNILTHLFVWCALFIFAFGLTTVPAKAAEHTATISVNRAAGECTYSVNGLDLTQMNALTLQVSHKNTQVIALQTNVTLNTTNCVNGTFTGSFNLSSLNGEYDEYTVDILIGTSKVTAGICDFSLHTNQLTMNVSGNSGEATRTITVNSSEPAGGVVIPGTEKQVSVVAWPEGSDETAAKTIALQTPFTESVMNITANIAQAGTAYGTWNAKLVLTNSKNVNYTLANTTYTISPTHGDLIIKKTKALEKKKVFAVTLSDLKNAYGIKKVSFKVYNSKGKKVTTVTGSFLPKDNMYYAEVRLKKLDYILDKYTIKVSLTDSNGTVTALSTSATADLLAQGGTLSVTKKSNATCQYKLTNAYLPGNIQKVRFVLYQLNGSNEKKIGTYNVTDTASKKTVKINVKNTDTGKYKLEVFGYTAWGKKILLNEETYRLSKKHMGKNGWYYEKYNGKKYKFYYINNKKQIDLTEILNLKKSSASSGENLYIEVNRAASAVTIYLYNEETGKYDIPVKTCSVSVGADTWTNAGPGGLHEKSSYTPLGTFSVCTNGQSVKYTVKPMHEPDGSTLYARWTTHIVGNVYFHSIAVGASSHYALPYYTYNRLGTPCSAGCIRMTVADAKWIFDYARTGTTVKINIGNSKKPGPLGKAPVIKTSAGINYDPTDPGVPDSQKKKDYKAKKITGYMTKSGKRVGY